MITSVRFRSEYVLALHEHVVRGDETTLRSGYELGRRAVSEGVSALDLAAVHHDALAASLGSTTPERTAEVVTAAAAFFQEILSAFEMVHRGYREAAAAAASERRHAAMLRQLSSFLADASLSARHTDAVTEVLHLVAEHARELTDARYSTVGWSTGSEEVRATSRDPELPAPADPDVLDRLARAGWALPSRVSRAEWPQQPALRGVGTVMNALTVPIVALDDRPVGLLQLVDKRNGDFTDADEAVAVHLADMTAAALERAELYRGQRLSL